MAKKISDLAAAAAIKGDELLELVQGGTNVRALAGALLPQHFIDGFKLVYVGPKALTVKGGAAFTPGPGRALFSPADIALTGLTLVASTWHHVYVYLNGAAPAAEVVTTGPAAAYSGTARAKTGDTSRRYLGSVLTDASGNLYAFSMNDGVVSWKVSIAAAPFLVIGPGASVTVANVSCLSAVPVTATHAVLILANTSSNAADAAMGTSDMAGGLSISTYMQYIGKGVQTTHAAPLDGVQSFNYVMTAAPGGGGFWARVAGYVYER
jgi:hypothetical protein